MNDKTGFSANDWSELLQCFLDESIEHLEGIENFLLQLESAPEEQRDSLINTVFRAAHSIKGSSGMFGFSNIHDLAHRLESLLEKIRSGKVEASANMIDVILKGFDQLKNLVENSVDSNNIDISDILAKLECEISEKPVMPAPRPSDKHGRGCSPPALTGACENIPIKEIEAALKLGFKVYGAKLNLISDIDDMGKSLIDFLKLLHGLGSVLHLQVDIDHFCESELSSAPVMPLEIIYSSEIEPGDINEYLEVPAGSFTPLPADFASISSGPATDKTLRPPQEIVVGERQIPENAEPTLRVKVSLLENLMNLAGELVLSRNQLREAINRSDMRCIRISGQRMGQVTTELQETIMMTRLQPIDRVFSKFPRMIRDLGRQLGKEIRLTLEGREVELDKTLIEGLGDPLTHMIRNAVDHGIETSRERLEAGKSLPANIRVNAFYEAGRVIIEVSDDGRGLDGEKICQKAIDKGLLSFERAKSMSFKEMQNLIFLPGFSTAETVTELSGRGVGMDVVKANIDRLGGKVEIVSEPGRGSSFKIKLPLTLAIIPSLILKSSDEIFAIPQANVLEMLFIPGEMIKRKIEIIGNREVLILRGKLLPLVSLNRFLGAGEAYISPQTGEKRPNRRKRIADRRSGELKRKPAAAASLNQNLVLARNEGRRYRNDSGINVVVVTTGSLVFGLIVDQPMYTEEIVVKQLGRDMKTLSEYSGATIMGDGKIALIIDVLGLAARAHILGQHAAITSNLLDAEKTQNIEANTLPFLAFKLEGRQNYALPLFLVAKLEKVLPDQLVLCGDWQAIQFNDRVLPLITLQPITCLSNEREWGVIVVRIKDREIGLLAALPIQVIEIKPEFDDKIFRRPGISGATVWQQESMLFIDIVEMIKSTRPELLDSHQTNDGLNDSFINVTILEPSAFFQNQLLLQLENEGCKVQITGSVKELEMSLKAARRPDAILADLGALKKDGFNILRRLRNSQQLQGIRMAAMWSDDADHSRDLTQEGIEAILQKLEMQQMADWINLIRN